MLLIDTGGFFYLELTDKTGPSLPILADIASLRRAPFQLVIIRDPLNQNLTFELQKT